MQEIFSSKERSTRLDRGDKRLMWALTLIYTVFTLLNLGTLSFPTSVWTAQSGAAVRIDLGAEYDVAEIWTNGNIAEGSAVFTGDDGSTVFVVELRDVVLLAADEIIVHHRHCNARRERFLSTRSPSSMPAAIAFRL